VTEDMVSSCVPFLDGLRVPVWVMGNSVNRCDIVLLSLKSALITVICDDKGGAGKLLLSV